tara:strand:- start:830 stop:1009 length:180 start_codon:yes stop_codon:yes gene_type:complete
MKLTDVKIADIQLNDFPNFTDAHVLEAKRNGKQLTEQELEEIPNDFINQFIFDNQLHIK